MNRQGRAASLKDGHLEFDRVTHGFVEIATDRERGAYPSFGFTLFVEDADREVRVPRRHRNASVQWAGGLLSFSLGRGHLPCYPSAPLPVRIRRTALPMYNWMGAAKSGCP